MTADRATALTNAAEEIRERYEHWVVAATTNDFAFFERVLADDWLYLDYTGNPRDKAEYLAIVRDLVLPSHQQRFVDVTVRLDGDVAIVHGRYLVNATLASGLELDLNLRFGGVWTRDATRGWRYRMHQATPVQPAQF